MSEYDFAVNALQVLAKHLEAWEPDRFSKATVVTFVRRAMDVVAEIGHDLDPVESYRQQLRLCREHNMLCLEYYRRHGVPKRQRIGKAVKA